jgi:sec-independent protein translocase protein TatC
MPITTVLTSVYGFVISVVLMLPLQLLFGVHLGVQTLLLVPGIVLAVLLVTSFSLVLSALHVYFRDVRFIVSAITLFVMGAGIAYWTLPKALQWLADIGGSNITQAYTADKYFQLIAYMMLAFGIGFEFPILLIFLQVAGIVKTDTLRKYWRHAVVVIAIVVAVATPSNDPISMLALSVPLWVFYGVAVLFGAVRDRRRRRAAAKS